MTAGRQWQPAPAGGVPPAKRHGHSLALVGVADALRHHPPTDAPHPALSCLLRLSPGTSAESCNAGGGSGRRPPRGGGWVVGTILWSRGHRPGWPGAGMGRPAMRRRRVATPPAARPPQRRTGAAATAAGRRSRVEPIAGPRGPHGAQGVCVRGGWEAALLNQNEKKKNTKKKAAAPPSCAGGRRGHPSVAAAGRDQSSRRHPLGTRPAWACCWPSRGTPTRQAGPPPPLSTTHPIWDGVVCRKSRQTPTSGVRPLPSPSSDQGWARDSVFQTRDRADGQAGAPVTCRLEGWGKGALRCRHLGARPTGQWRMRACPQTGTP